MSKDDAYLPLYLVGGDPKLSNYRPLWLDNLADDVTLEGSMLDGVVVGKDGVHAVVSTIRSLYDRQAHKFAGPSGDGGFLEDYAAEVRGGFPIGCVLLASFNGAGKAQHIVASYRPRTSVVRFAKLLAEEFAGTDIAKHLSDA